MWLFRSPLGLGVPGALRHGCVPERVDIDITIGEKMMLQRTRHPCVSVPRHLSGTAVQSPLL